MRQIGTTTPRLRSARNHASACW